MSILLDENAKVIVQGITGKAGGFHALACRDYGTRVVGGVTPGKGGSAYEGIPVFDTVESAVKETGANATMIYVPAAFATEAILEAADSGIKLIVTITEGIPVIDMLTVKNYLKTTNSVLIGPNCPGIISPGKAKIGIMPGYIHKPGRVGLVSRSGTLTYEAVHQLSERNIGQSTCIGIGGDPIHGLSFLEALERFNADPDTDAIVLIGEIGGTAEEQAAEYVKGHVKKPVVGFVGGVTAPPGKRMGHAGAIISGGSGKAADKIAALERAGVAVAKSPAMIGETMEKLLR